MFFRYVTFICFFSTVSAFSAPAAAQANLKLKAQVDSLPSSWALAFSPDGDLFVTHREGGLSRFTNDLRRSEIAFLPDDLLPGGQGGLLDIIFHPNYEETPWVYLSYSAGSEDENALKVVRFMLNDDVVQNLETVFELHDTKDTPVHYGGRLAFHPDGGLLIATGDGFDYREKAQIKESHLGKILRVTDTGEAHPDNPFYTSSTSPSSFIFSLGHRNPQGLLTTPKGQIVAHEHGPAGGDEINIIESGKNYGWPVVTNGKDYIGATISPFKDYPGMVLPSLDWTPSIAPSGMVYYTRAFHPQLSNHLLITSLKFQQVYAVPFNNGQLGESRVILNQSGARLRDIEVDGEGGIWVLGDGANASLFKVENTLK